MLYHDYIKYLWQIDFTHAYITNWGFESLSKLATELFGEGPLEDCSKLRLLDRILNMKAHNQALQLTVKSAPIVALLFMASELGRYV